MNLLKNFKKTIYAIIFVCYQLWNEPIDKAEADRKKRNRLTPSSQRRW